MTPISSLKFSNIENYHFFRVSVDQEKKVEKKKYVSVFRFGVSVFRCFVSLFRGLVMSFLQDVVIKNYVRSKHECIMFCFV